MQMLDALPPALGVVLGLLALVWLVLWLLVPFMIESIRNSSRKTYLELEATNRKLDRLLALLAERGASAPTGDPAHASGQRKEPHL
jgi:hypothetical protein